MHADEDPVSTIQDIEIIGIANAQMSRKTRKCVKSQGHVEIEIDMEGERKGPVFFSDESSSESEQSALHESPVNIRLC